MSDHPDVTVQKWIAADEALAKLRQGPAYWVVFYNLAGYEFHSSKYMYEANADWFLAYVRTKPSHRFSRKMAR